MKIRYNGFVIDPVEYKPRFHCTIWVGENFGFKVLIIDDKIADIVQFGFSSGMGYSAFNYNVDHVLLSELFLRIKDNLELLMCIIKNDKSIMDEIRKDNLSIQTYCTFLIQSHNQL
jgi:hypothetical protein